MNSWSWSAALVAAIAATSAQAQPRNWSAEQTQVWNVVSQSWVDEVAENGRWPAAYVHDQVVQWDSSWPSPRGKSSMEKWSRFGDQQNQTLQYELFPEAIVMSGDTAVVHYSGVIVTQRAQDKPEREVFGTVETLVRDGGTWKFLSLTGFEIGDDD